MKGWMFENDRDSDDDEGDDNDRIDLIDVLWWEAYSSRTNPSAI